MKKALVKFRTSPASIYGMTDLSPSSSMAVSARTASLPRTTLKIPSNLEAIMVKGYVAKKAIHATDKMLRGEFATIGTAMAVAEIEGSVESGAMYPPTGGRLSHMSSYISPITHPTDKSPSSNPVTGPETIGRQTNIWQNWKRSSQRRPAIAPAIRASNNLAASNQPVEE